MCFIRLVTVTSSPSSSRRCFIFVSTLDMKLLRVSMRSFNVSVISLYPAGSRYISARSSSSHFALCIPRRWAMGAYISIVSSDFCRCFSSV